jgi:glycosyltransferase involved in cell wall biosynthesis
VMSDLIGLPAMLAASIVGIPRVVVSARSGSPPARGRPDHLLRPVYQTALARDQVALVANSSATAREFVEWLQNSALQVGVIYNGVDVEGLVSQRDPAATSAHRRALGIPDRARVVGSVFKARAVKRPRLWIEAAAIIAARAPDVVFVIVGDKFERVDVTAAITKHGLRDRFHLPGLRRDVPTWLDLMDVFLLTSEAEGTPVALLEAQALGRPVVATDAGGNAECFLPDVTGILLSANPTPEQVADAVLRVLNDPGFTARANQHGSLFIRERFDSGRMAREYVDLCFAPPSASAKRTASA